MSKPILATRGNALLAVAKVPCTGWEQLVPGAEPRQRPVDPHAVLLAAGDQLTKRILGQQCGHVRRERGARPGERVTGLTQLLRRLDEGIAVLARDAGGGPLEKLRTDEKVVVQLGLALARVQLRGDVLAPGGDRIAPAVHSERPQSDGIGDELPVEDIGFPAW
jgi:hypothetical protein